MKHFDFLPLTLGYVECPLCDATGTYLGSDCAVCNGEREIDKDTAENVDLSEYKVVKCPLCEGTGSHDGNDCPECGGNREMERRFADRMHKIADQGVH